ncbi:MAG: hypothetical protein PVJ57_07560 [Phycisphaerae bacterium]
MMLSKRVRMLALLAALSIGTAFSVGTNGCAEFYTTMTVGSFDFCSVFNCEGGSYFNFCSPIRLFADCPQTGE